MPKPVDLERLLSRLDGVRRRGGGAMARCPAHDDRTPSLSITQADNGNVLWKCFAGCSQADVTQALRRIGALPAADEPVEPAAAAAAERAARAAQKAAAAGNGKPTGPPALPDRLWRGARTAAGTPAERYLAEERGLPAAVRHPDIRWLPWNAAVRLECRPEAPRGAAGVILYRYANDIDEPDAAGALQMEALSHTGRRIPYRDGVKRISTLDSIFGTAARVFRARRNLGTKDVWLTEGPLDALAVLALEALTGGSNKPEERKKFNTAGADIIGIAGSGNVREEMIRPYKGSITAAFDNDGSSYRGANRIDEMLAAEGADREVYRHHPDGEWSKDWNDVLLRRLRIGPKGG